jgi:hypothetical protein
MMIISICEQLILLKLWELCINPNDKIALYLLYGVTSKNYLYKNINILIDKGLINFEFYYNKKYIYFTDNGYKLTKVLKIKK